MSWLKRYRVSRGFSVHSPFAFYFITKVLRDKGRYYCFDTEVTDREERRLFRVTNYLQPRSVCIIGAEGTARALEVMRLACGGIELTDEPAEADMVFAAPDCGPLPADCAALYAPRAPHGEVERLLAATTAGATFESPRVLVAVRRKGVPRMHYALL